MRVCLISFNIPPTQLITGFIQLESRYTYIPYERIPQNPITIQIMGKNTINSEISNNNRPNTTIIQLINMHIAPDMVKIVIGKSASNMIFSIFVTLVRTGQNLARQNIMWHKNSEGRFRSSDLWVMGPARFHCATSLKTFLKILL